MQKRILFLGGSHFATGAIIYAKQQGHYVITCDYLPDNPGHKYADEYHNISTINKEAVLQLARQLAIDGVVAIASDPSAPTAAYVANVLSLPGNPYDAVFLLTRKDLFKAFLRENNFKVPRSASFSLLKDAQEYYNGVKGSVIVKPVDASGSKGVSKVERPAQLPAAFEFALSFSKVKKVIIEEYINRKGYQIAGDGFVVDGKLAFRCFAQEHFNENGNPFVPIGESFPLQLPQTLQTNIHNEVERLISLLHIRLGALNLDIIINENDEIFLLEIAPRSGGNFISKVIKYCTGTNLDKYAVDSALGNDCSALTMYNTSACYASYMISAKNEGIYKGIEIDKSLLENIEEQIMFTKPGMRVTSFENAGCALGCLILKFKTPDEMLEKMETVPSNVRTIIA